MLTGIDRVQIATHDRHRAAETWRRLFDAEVVGEDRVRPLAAARLVLRAGDSEIELLEPDGIGAVAQHLSRSRSALYAVGLATRDLGAARAALDARAVHHVVDGRQLLITGEWLGIPGLRVVLSQAETRKPAGLLRHVYEVTHLMRGYARAADRLAKTFDLDPAGFVPIRSDAYGYAGLLTLIDRDQLDRVETVTPFDRSKTMGRFFQRQGPSLYMFYAEASEAAALRERLLEHAPQDWTGPRDGAEPDNLFVHPRALDGALLGVSRETMAWTWSGHPERVRPPRGPA